MVIFEDEFKEMAKTPIGMPSLCESGNRGCFVH